MLTRIIVAAIGIPLLLLVIFLAPLWVFGLVVAAIASMASWELLRCVKPDMPRRLRIYTAIGAAIIPLGSVLGSWNAVVLAGMFFVMFAVFGELMWSFQKETRLELEVVMLVMMGGIVLPMMISALVRLGLQKHSAQYILLPLVAAFSSDSGAYFVGSFLGKTKMTPHLSPNKTIEGAAGGFFFSVLDMLIYGLILMLLGYEVNFVVMAVYGFMGSLACQAGDLSFSAVKRICGVKDYGTLFPGHGGMLDRFDSMFFTAPMIEILVLWVPAIMK